MGQVQLLRYATASLVQESVKQAHKHHSVKSLPEEFLSEDALVFLNIPMDAETPTMRLLRPQVGVFSGRGAGFAGLCLPWTLPRIWRHPPCAMQLQRLYAQRTARCPSSKPCTCLCKT